MDDAHAQYSEGISLTYGKEPFDSSATPVSVEQVPAGPVLVFKAPPGTVFLADVEISIPVDKAILALLYEVDEDEDEERRHHILGSSSSHQSHFAQGSRKLLQATTVQEIKQHWFNSETKVNPSSLQHFQLYIVLFLYLCLYVIHEDLQEAFVLLVWCQDLCASWFV